MKGYACSTVQALQSMIRDKLTGGRVDKQTFARWTNTMNNHKLIWYCMLSSFTMPQDMQEFTGDGCTHGQAWLAIFNRSTTCMYPHSHSQPDTLSQCICKLGFPVRVTSHQWQGPALPAMSWLCDLHPVSPVKSHVQDLFSQGNETSFLEKPGSLTGRMQH